MTWRYELVSRREITSPHRCWPQLAVTVPVLVYFLPLVVLSRAPIDFGGDVAFYFYPFTAIGMASWHQGQVPLWTANIQTGFPLLADGQGALLYPLNLLTYWLLPGPLAHNLTIMVHSLLSAILMYCLARELKLPAMPAVLSSWIWVAVAVFGIQGSPQLNALTWWPLLVLIALRLAVGRKGVIYVPLTGLVTGLMWLGGFPQTTIYGIILASAFFFYAMLYGERPPSAQESRVYPLDRNGLQTLEEPAMASTPEDAVAALAGKDQEVGKGDHGGTAPTALATANHLVKDRQTRRHMAWIEHYLWPIAFWGLGLALGVGLAAIQLLPTLEMAGQSVRSGGLDYGLATQGSLFPTGLLNYLTPGWAVEGNLSARVYMGVIALALALLRLRRGMSLLDKFLWVICGVALLLAFGKSTPLYYFVSKLPGLSFLRVPLRFALLTTFCLSILAAEGFNQLISAVAAPDAAARALQRLQKRLRLLVGILIVISLVGGVVAQLGRPLLLDLAKQVVQGSLLGTRFRVQGWEYYEVKINTIYTQITPSLSPLNPQTLQPIAIGLLALLAVWYWKRSKSPHQLLWPPTVLLILMGLEMALLIGSPLGRVSSADLLAAPRLVDRLQKASPATPTAPNRLYELATQSDIIASSNQYANLMPNFNLLFGVPHTGASSALGSLRYFDFLGPLGGVNLAYGLPPSSPEILRQDLHVLNLLGARYIIANQPLDDPRLAVLSADQPYLYLNSGALPRAFFVPEAVTATPDEALRLVRSPVFAPLERVVLEKNVDVEFIPNSQIPMAEIVEDQNELLRIRTQGTGWLVLTDLYYPSWRATVDGVETPIYRANAVFRAVAVAEPGVHLITFSYEPDSFKHGMWLSGLSFLLISGLIGFFRCNLSR